MIAQRALGSSWWRSRNLPRRLAILDQIDRDIRERPWAIKPIPKVLFDLATELTEDIDVDLDAPIEGWADMLPARAKLWSE